MEYDRDLGLVNRKADVEVPKDWMEVFRSARKNPSPYNVIEITQRDIFGYTKFLKPMFRATCTFPTRPIRELVVRKEKPLLVEFRNNWSGEFSSGVVVARGAKAKDAAAAVRANRPEQLYLHPIPLSKPKFKDLQVLKNFCTKESSLLFFNNLPHDGDTPDQFHDYESDSDSE
ncbi:hypothetical protein PoB_004191700 [Plakobranchus ocellatus]|uniref:Uncharacterized protein n=1 Tax=Plakobranchus ocellatus TaxID=259542 RepID=A0AAV4B7E8_9GAST|nr:hypothetical protein PoB_004191700 [Plakobranchus ocellatus]